MNMTSRLNQIPNHHTHARHCAGPVLSLLLFLLSPPVFAQTPAAPTGLTVTGASGSAISLSWTAPAGETIVRGYNVFRCVSPCTLDSSDRSSWRAWVTQGGGDPHPAPTQYTDASVTSGTTYVYAVEAEVNDDYVRSAWSNQVTATATGLSTQETTGQLVVDTGNALRVHEENPIGINLNYIRDHDDNRADGAIPLEQAMREMGVRWLRYPGGEKSDWHFFASPPYEEADPVILDRTYNYRRELVVDEPYSQHAEGYTPLDFDTYMDYVKKSDGEPYVVVPFEPESRSGISAETYIRHAAAWVRYANETKGYEVEYWEIGNENWGGGVDTRDYATRGLEIAKAMKEVDPDIKIGMSGNYHEQFKTVLDIAGEYLDFLTLSNYRGDGWGENGFDHYRALPNGTLSKADDAVRAIATSDYADRIEVVIAEFNAADFQQRWPWRNDLGHAIVVFDMLGEFLYDPYITSAMLWTTRWMNADDPYQMWYALDNENRPTAVGRALTIWGRFFKPNMVEVTVPMAGMNAYAAFDPVQETLTLFVINKSRMEQTMPVRVECGAGFAKCGSGFNNADVYHFTGTGDSDMSPQFRKADEPVEVTDNMLELRLPHTSITVIDYKFSDGGPITITDSFTVVVGGMKDVDLPAAFMGEEIEAPTYTARSGNPAVATVSLNDDLLTVTGASAGTAIVTVTASNGSKTIIRSFEVTVNDSIQKAQRGWLARFGRSVATSAVEMIGGHLQSLAPPMESSQLTLGGRALSLDDLETSVSRYLFDLAKDGTSARSISARQLFSDSEFHLALGGNGAGGSAASSVAVWGKGDFTRFRGSGSDGVVIHNAEVLSGYLGVDFHWRSDILLGLAVSYTDGEGDYRHDNDKGALSSNLTSVYPYLRWSLSDKLSAWGLVGYGKGSMEMRTGQTKFETDIDMQMAAVGVRGELLSAGSMELALKTDAFMVQMEADGTRELQSVDAYSERLRLALEGRGNWSWSDGVRLEPSLELAMRVDGGDADDGFGAELGGGIAYYYPQLGLGMEARGRVLLMHDANDYKEWGASLAVRLAPVTAFGYGLSFSLTPTWGDMSNDTAALWDNPAMLNSYNSGGVRTATWRPDHLRVRLAYGLPWGWRNLVTPFGEVDIAGGHSSRRVRLGTTLDIGRNSSVLGNLQVEIYGEQLARANADDENRLWLNGNLRY